MPHCSEAWDAISRYIYTGLQGGSIMKDWMKEENTNDSLLLRWNKACNI